MPSNIILLPVFWSCGDLLILGPCNRSQNRGRLPALVCLAVIAGHSGLCSTGLQVVGIATSKRHGFVPKPFGCWSKVGRYCLTGFVSVGSLVAAMLLPVATSIFYPGRPYLLIFGIGAALLAIYRHIPNIKRLVRGEENRLFGKGKEE